jgi:hypothetical protein
LLSHFDSGGVLDAFVLSGIEVSDSRVAYPDITMKEGSKQNLRHSESDAYPVFLPRRTCVGPYNPILNFIQCRIL